jgi:tetratricopeptide (TPR) repeat protein
MSIFRWGSALQRQRRAIADTLLALLLSLVCAAWPAMVHSQATTRAAPAPDVEMKSGTQAFRRGDFTQALKHWSAAASAYEATGNQEGQVSALVHGADAELNLGRSPDAVARLQKAQAIAERTGKAPLILAVESSLGNAYALSGRDADAERMLRSSVERANKAGDAETAARALNNLGNLLAMQGRFGDASRSFREAIDAANRAGNTSLGIRASTNLARALLDEGRHR